MYYLGTDKQSTRILNDKIDDCKMLFEGGSLNSKSRSFKTIKILKAYKGILPNPCTHCGDPISTTWSKPLKLELIKKNICHRCHFWFEKVKWKNDNNSNVVRIKNNHYLIAPDNSKALFQGFGGRKFKIKFKDGREVISYNLWHQGTIPDVFKELLPDNAIFI